MLPIRYHHWGTDVTGFHESLIPPQGDEFHGQETSPRVVTPKMNITQLQSRTRPILRTVIQPELLTVIVESCPTGMNYFLMRTDTNEKQIMVSLEWRCKRLHGRPNNYPVISFHSLWLTCFIFNNSPCLAVAVVSGEAGVDGWVIAIQLTDCSSLRVPTSP